MVRTALLSMSELFSWMTRTAELPPLNTNRRILVGSTLAGIVGLSILSS